MTLARHKYPARDLRELAEKMSEKELELLAKETYGDSTIAFAIGQFGHPEKLNFYNSERATHSDMREELYSAFHDFKSTRLIRQIEIENTSRFGWVNLLLPRKRGEGTEITVSRLVYHQGMLDREPEGTASKVMEKTPHSLTFKTTRFGKSIEMLLDIMMHPQGKENFRNQIAQVNSAILFTQQNMTLAHLSENAQLCNTLYLKHRKSEKDIGDSFDAECFTFGMINRQPRAIYFLMNRARETLKGNSIVTPNTVVCNANIFSFISMHSPFETKAADTESREIMKHPKLLNFVDYQVFEIEPMIYEGNVIKYFERTVTLGRSHSIFCQDFAYNNSSVPFDSRKQMSFCAYNVVSNAFREVPIQKVLLADPRWDGFGNFDSLLYDICHNPLRFFREQKRPFVEGKLIDPYCFSTTKKSRDHTYTSSDQWRPCDTFGDMDDSELTEDYLRFMSSKSLSYFESAVGAKTLENVNLAIELARELNSPPSKRADEKLCNFMAAVSLMDVNSPSLEEKPFLAHTGGAPQIPYRNADTGYLYMLDPATNFRTSRNVDGSPDDDVVVDTYAYPLIAVKKNPTKNLPEYNNHHSGSDTVQYLVAKYPERVGGFMVAGNAKDQVVTHVLVKVSDDASVPLELQELDYSEGSLFPFRLERCKSYDKPYGYAHLKGLEAVASLINEDGCRGWDKGTVKKADRAVNSVRNFMNAMLKNYPESAFVHPGNVSADLFTGDVHHDRASAWFEHAFLPFTHTGVLLRSPNKATRLRYGIGSGENVSTYKREKNNAGKKRKRTLIKRCEKRTKKNSRKKDNNKKEGGRREEEKENEDEDEDDDDDEDDDGNDGKRNSKSRSRSSSFGNNNNHDSTGKKSRKKNRGHDREEGDEDRRNHHDHDDDEGDDHGHDDDHDRDHGSDYDDEIDELNNVDQKSKGYDGTLFVEGDIITVDPIYYSLCNLALDGSGNAKIDYDSGETPSLDTDNYFRLLVAFDNVPDVNGKIRWLGPYDNLTLKKDALYFRNKKVTDSNLRSFDSELCRRAFHVHEALKEYLDTALSVMRVMVRFMPSRIAKIFRRYNPSTASNDPVHNITEEFYQILENSNKKTPRVLQENGFIFAYLKLVIEEFVNEEKNAEEEEGGGGGGGEKEDDEDAIDSNSSRFETVNNMTAFAARGLITLLEPMETNTFDQTMRIAEDVVKHAGAQDEERMVNQVLIDLYFDGKRSYDPRYNISSIFVPEERYEEERRKQNLKKYKKHGGGDDGGSSGNNSSGGGGGGGGRRNEKAHASASQGVYRPRIEYDEATMLYQLTDKVTLANKPVDYHVSRLSLDPKCFFGLTESGNGIQKLHTLPMWPNHPYDPFLPPVVWLDAPWFLSAQSGPKDQMIKGFRYCFTGAYASLPYKKIDRSDGVFIGSLSYFGAWYGDRCKEIEPINQDTRRMRSNINPYTSGYVSIGNNNGNNNNNNNNKASGSSGRKFVSSSSSFSTSSSSPFGKGSAAASGVQYTHRIDETSTNRCITVITRGRAPAKDVINHARLKIEKIRDSVRDYAQDTMLVWRESVIGPDARFITNANVPRFNMIDRFVSCHERSGNRLENAISLMILSSPPTRTQMLAWVASGLPIPYSYTVIEPFNQVDMSSIFVADRNGIGNFYFTDSHCNIQFDGTHKKFHANYKVNLGAAVVEPNKMTIIADVCFNGIVRGFDLSFNTNKKDCDFSRIRVDARDSRIQSVEKSAFVLGHGPGMNQNPKPFITLTGMINRRRHGANSVLKPGESVDYAGSLFYTQYWSFHALNLDPDDAGVKVDIGTYDDLRSYVWVNDIASQWIQYNWDPVAMKYSTRIKGEGLLGDWECDDMKAVLNGEILVGGNFDTTQQK